VYRIFDCTIDKVVCNYYQPFETSEALTARRLTIGGAGCFAPLLPDSRLTTIGSESVTLMPGADFQLGSNFNVRIVPCYNVGDPQGMILQNEASASEGELKFIPANLDAPAFARETEHMNTHALARTVSIHPNPVAKGEQLTLNNLPPCSNSGEWLAICDASGRLVHQQTRQCGSEERMSTKGIEAGVYFISVGDSEKSIFIGRCIIQ